MLYKRRIERNFNTTGRIFGRAPLTGRIFGRAPLTVFGRAPFYRADVLHLLHKLYRADAAVNRQDANSPGGRALFDSGALPAPVEEARQPW